MSEARVVPPVRVEVWSDVVCPFCWVGKARLEEALAAEGQDAEVVFRAFELDPTRASSEPLPDYLARRFGSAANVRAIQGRVEAMGAPHGLRFEWARAVSAPTVDAHRLVLHAQEQGLASAMMERLMRAHFQEGADLRERATLARLADEVGVRDAAALLGSDARLAEVREDELRARALGIGGVPFFLIDGRYAVSGAQPVEVFREALRVARGAAPMD